MKRFYNNTIMSGALSKALRVLALLCVLLGVSSSAWADELNSSYKGKSIYVAGSFNNWSTSDWKLSTTDNNYYSGEFTIVGKSDNYTFKIYSEGKYFSVDGYWFTSSNKTATTLVTDKNDMQIDCISESGNISVKFELHCEYSGTSRLTVTQTSIVADPEYALGGWINKSDKKSYSNGIKLTKQNDGTYTTTTSFTQNADPFNGKSGQWVQIYGNDSKKYGFSSKEQSVALNTEATLVAVTTDDGFFIETTIGTNYTFTWNPTTKKFKYTGDSGGDDDDDDDTGDCKTLYLEPTDHWNKDGARFAAYFYGGGPAEIWVDMKGSTCNGLWKVAVPNSAYTNVIFVRMNGSTTDNGWGNKWNQTADLSISGTNNQYTISDVNGGGSWKVSACTDKAECNGSSGDDEPDDCDYVEIYARGKGSYTDIYCNVTSATAQSTGIKEYNGNNYATWKVTTKTAIAVSFCAGDNHGYCTNTASMEPGNRYYCEFAAANWGSQNYTITQTEPLECNNEQTAVLLSKQAVVNKTAGKATLYGYLSSTNCDKQIVEYGFYYCRVIDGNKCKPTASSYKLQVSPSEALLRGQEFSAELDVEDGYSYYYRAYAKINDVDVLSAETRLISTDPCVQQVCCGEPVVYTINADPDFMENVCKLHFNSLQDAIDHLKNSASRSDAYQYVEKVGESYNLKQPVVMNVVYYDDTPLDNTSAYIYRGTDEVGYRAGDAVPKNSNLIKDINRTATNAANTLTIKAGTKTAKPWIHHIVLRNSKNIVLDSLCIYSDPVLYEGKTIGDNAIEMDINHADGSQRWNELNTRTGEGLDNKGFLSNANILVQNCMIGSDGFTGAHISSYDGVTFKNNDFEIVAGANMDKNYGASFKLLYCKNVKFIENNFRGDHATLMWIQEVQNMLVMNNVFWNTNKLVIDQEGDQYPAAMRLVTQFSNSIANVGFFYNTYYFAENNVTVAVPSGYDFLQMTHTVSGGSGDIDINTIKFQYNNCYSYDADAHGRTADNYNILNPGDRSKVIQTGPFLGYNLGSNSNFCPNNFWSQYDDDNDYSTSKFAFGCAQNEFTNVKGQVCETSASGPASLMIKGEDLNNGVKPNIAFTGITLTDEEWYSDRYLTAVRPKADEGWTYGAYQSKGEIKTNTIYWVGTTDKWDDRNNWEYETRDASGKMIRQRVSCINTLSEDLKVVIEEIGTVEVAGGRKWPKVPASFNANDRKTESGVPVGEQVSAGESGKFASTIELEYGAGLRGVENLKDSEGNVLYNNAIVHFDADRDKWLLVGHIVKPWDETTKTYRTGLSGDYYLQHVPQVYMHQAQVESDNITWGKTFASLEVPVPSNEVYAINVTSMYGTSWMPAEVYNYFNKTNYKGDAPNPYTFTGRFAVAEDNEPGQVYEYGNLTAGKKNLLNNVYPCNINAKEIESQGLGTINVYDYENGSFVNTSATQATGNVYIKSQNGFVFIPDHEKGITNLELNDGILAEGSTRTRAGEIPLPTFSLNVDNANTTDPGASNVVIRYDEFLGDDSSLLNTPKVFTKNADTPEAYIINGNGQYARLDTGKDKVCIPLGVRLMKPMNLTFEKVYNEGYDEVVLVDTKTQKFYNLLKRNYTTEKLETDTTEFTTLEGRFYLNLTISGDEDLEDEGDNPAGDDIVDDDDVTTEVEETIEEADINIYSVDNSIVRVSSVGTALKAIYVSDMTGRTDSYNVDGNYVELQLPVSSGVYTVTVIGETASKVGKVILK